MSKYTIKHTCGHTVEHQIYGTNVNGERENKAEWLSSRLCADCYKAEQLDKAKDTNAELPTLTGSEKQIAWAESIRAAAVSRMDKIQPNLDNCKKSNPTFYVAIADLIDEAVKNSSAKFWIDNRDNLIGSENWLRGIATKAQSKMAS